MNRQFKEQVWRTSFNPTAASVAFEEKLKAAYGMKYRYDSARLLIGRSLAEPTPPDPVPKEGKTTKKSIPGENLFGENDDLWICALVLDGRLGLDSTLSDFRDLVEAHWARGYRLVKDELEASNEDELRLAQRLADLLPENGIATPTIGGEMAGGKAGEIRLKVGTISETHPGGKPVDFVLNGPGSPPHIALMGAVGKGKTTTGVQVAMELADKAQIPFLYIDPKGEFVEDGKLQGAFTGMDGSVKAVEVGTNPVPLDFLPPADAPHQTIARAAMSLRDTIMLCCKSPGDLQQDLLRTSLESLIEEGADHSLENINNYYQQALANEGKRPDSIVSRLNELTNLDCFNPEQPPAQFFGQSWVISLKSLPEELTRLSTLIILNTISAHLLQQKDSDVHDGFRTLRHLLVLDEARKVLQERKSDSLSDLIRQGRSKGSVVMLLSQDPSDFEGAADDFLTQIGTVIAYACAQSQRGLGALKGVFGRKLQANEFSDTYLPNGVAFVKLPEREAERIRCWGTPSDDGGE